MCFQSHTNTLGASLYCWAILFNIFSNQEKNLNLEEVKQLLEKKWNINRKSLITLIHLAICSDFDKLDSLLIKYLKEEISNIDKSKNEDLNILDYALGIFRKIENVSEKDFYIQYLIKLEEEMKPIVENLSDENNDTKKLVERVTFSLLKWLKSGISNLLGKLLYNLLILMS